jgi:hypothetical protein
MSNLKPDDFEEILNTIKRGTDSFLQYGDIWAIESNFNTKGIKFNAKKEPGVEGMVIAGEDNGAVAIDISVGDGAVRSVILRDKDDEDAIHNVVGWLQDQFRFQN